MVRNGARMLGDVPDAGLQVGTTYHLSTFGILGYAPLASHTVLDAMNLALLLGYAEASSFNHAFKRWTGTLSTQSTTTRSPGR